jgi:1,4-dihydroxy-2-naphthoyl-CoA hydrolase
MITIPRTVLINDVDAAGVVFYARSIAIAHEAYEEAMARCGLPFARVVASQRYALPVVHVEADYRRALRHGDLIECRVRAGEASRASYTILVGLWSGGAEAVAIKQVHVQLDLASARAVRLDDEVRAALDRLGPDAP